MAKTEFVCLFINKINQFLFILELVGWWFCFGFSSWCNFFIPINTSLGSLFPICPAELVEGGVVVVHIVGKEQMFFTVVRCQPQLLPGLQREV